MNVTCGFCAVEDDTDVDVEEALDTVEELICFGCGCIMEVFEVVDAEETLDCSGTVDNNSLIFCKGVSSAQALLLSLLLVVEDRVLDLSFSCGCGCCGFGINILECFGVALE